MVADWWQYLRTCHDVPVALIHAKMSKRWMHKIVGLFQEEPKVVNDWSKLTPPRFLVETTKLLGVGLTLTRARRLVQLDPEWLLQDEHQACKRINWISQTGQTYTYSVHCIDFVAKSMIFDRQNCWENLKNLALNATNIDLTVRKVERKKREYDNPKENKDQD